MNLTYGKYILSYILLRPMLTLICPDFDIKTGTGEMHVQGGNNAEKAIS